jgi:Divergent InlB B-repeat domain/IPTL-CTERM motif
MTFGKTLFVKLGAMALGVLLSLSAGAGGAQVTSRFAVVGGAATSTKIVPGGAATFEVRVDAPATNTIGLAYRITQFAPVAPTSLFTITGRVDVGDPPAPANPLYPYNDQSSGTPTATVLIPANALLSPQNNQNLGRNAAAFAVGIPPGTNILATTITLTSDPSTPLGTYTIRPTSGGTSSVTDAAFNDYDMATTATFDIIVGQTLTVTTSGTGTGTVTSSPGLINCTSPGTGVCSDIFPGTAVTLTPTAAGGSVFIGWTGACSGAGACVVTVDAAKTVNAIFDLGPQTLTVTINGTGTGTVASAPAGIACAPTCSAMFPANSTVILTATPGVGSAFTGWSGGGCSGTAPCTVTMSVARAVTATFDLPPFTLTITKTGNGTGTVTSAPAGIACGATCSASFPSTTVVVLTAVATAGSTFNGWSGVPAVACPGTGTCSVTILAAQTVTANFTDVTPPITTITGGPTNPSNDPNPVFTFTSNEPGSTFLCTLDGSVAVACTTPHQVSVGNGPHTFTVQAVDPAGNLGNIVTYPWLAAGIVITNVPIPTLNEWMLVLLAMVLGTAGILARRRKN